ATATVRVNGANDAPVVLDSNSATPEDSALNGSVASLGSDADSEALSYVQVGTLAGLTLNANGSFTFNPAPHATGDGSFQFQGFCGTAYSNTGTFTITILPQNDAPSTPTGVAATVAEDSTTFFSFASLLAGAADVDNDTLSVTGIDFGTYLRG